MRLSQGQRLMSSLAMQTTSGVVVRELCAGDRSRWLHLRQQLWPDSDEVDAMTWASREDAMTLIAEDPQEGIIGFAEVGLRPYADGCDTSPVAFLEGWYVCPLHRRRNVGKSLVQAAVGWATKSGVHELASDSLLEDVTASIAHIRVGFEEVERSIRYRMPLDRTATNQ